MNGICTDHHPLRPPLMDATRRLNNCPAAKTEQGSPYTEEHDLLETPDRMSTVASPVSTQENVKIEYRSSVSHSQVGPKRSSVISASSILSGKGKRKTHVGPWQLGRDLGRGATGRVRLAKHAVTGQTAAIKIVSKSSAAVAQSASIAALDRTVNRYGASGLRQMPSSIEREVVIMKLIEHPNVMSLYDVWENRGELYLVLEYVEGGELFDYVSKYGPLPEEEAVRLFRQIIAGVGYCHRFNICHRDLKPENILLDSWYNIKIADFGMAALQPDGHWLKTSCGSPHYAAPEILHGHKYRGDKADIWSCGIILFALLNGYLPFDGNNLPRTLRAVKKGEYVIPGEISVEASDLIQRILQKRPKDRITMEGIWMHPLLKKYEKLHQTTSHHVGPAPPLTKQECGLPVASRQDIDRDILSNLQTLWHDATRESLQERIMDPEPTQERLFYNALVKFRDEQIENYDGQSLNYSLSDYHHMSRGPNPTANKRKSIRIPGGPGKYAQASISHDNQQQSTPKQLKSSATEKSYDPFRSPRYLIPGPEAQYAQVTIHRKSSGTDVKDLEGLAPESTEIAEGEIEDEEESLPSSPFSIIPNKKPKASVTRSFHSRASHSSSRRIINSGATPRSTSYKRNVLFQHNRARSQGSTSIATVRSRAMTRSVSRQSSESSLKSDIAAGPFSNARSSPPLPSQPIVVRRSGIQIKNCPQVKRVCESDIVWKDEARQVSHELSQICEEAFNSSFLSTGCTTSTCMGSETPATSISMASAGDSQQQIFASNNQLKQLPAKIDELPKSKTARQLAETRRRLMQHSTQNGSPDVTYVSAVINLLDRLIAQHMSRSGDEEEISDENAALNQDLLAKYLDETISLPKISEEPTNPLKNSKSISENEEVSRDNSQSASSICTRRQSRDGKTTIRMVSPSGQHPLEEIKPLNIRKNRSVSDEGRRPEGGNIVNYDTNKRARSAIRYVSADSRHTRFLCELDPIQEVPKSPKQSQTKIPDNKKWSWFRGKSLTTAENTLKVVTDIKPIYPSSGTVIVHQVEPPSNSGPDEQPKQTKTSKDSSGKQKGGFFKKFIKKKQDKNALNSPAESEFAESTPLIQRPMEIGQSSDTEKVEKPLPRPPRSSGRSQNWFARVFQIKPATRVLALNTSKMKARKDVLKILREWKHFGIKNAYLDKANGVIHSRVGPANYLRLRAVNFSAEFYTVLEHGQKANLSLVRFRQDRGAASSFHKVVDSLEIAMAKRSLLVEDPERAQKMAQILDAFPES